MLRSAEYSQTGMELAKTEGVCRLCVLLRMGLARLVLH